jgi:hypothetical protein
MTGVHRPARACAGRMDAREALCLPKGRERLSQAKNNLLANVLA